MVVGGRSSSSLSPGDIGSTPGAPVAAHFGENSSPAVVISNCRAALKERLGGSGCLRRLSTTPIVHNSITPICAVNG
jgi:hypothetical protein